MSRSLGSLCLLLVPILFAKVGSARPQDDSLNTGSQYEVEIGGDALTTAHAPMLGGGAAYVWNGRLLHFKVRHSYRWTFSERGGVRENDMRTALMGGLHRQVQGRRVALSTGGGIVFGGRYSGILLFGEVPIRDRFIGLGVPIEVNATLVRFGNISLALSLFGFIHATSLTGEQKGSALSLSVTTRFGSLF